jgi:hypothetical protein
MVEEAVKEEKFKKTDIPWPFCLSSFLPQVILLKFNICTQFYIKCVKR